LLVWRSIRCDALGLNAPNMLGLKTSLGRFHAHREPQQSTRFGAPRNNSYSR
jgi:hypothetical protein